MSPLLGRIGAWSFKHKYTVIISWIVVVIVTLSAMAIFQKPVTSELSIPGTDGQLALDKARETFPKAGNASGNIVFEAPEGKTIDDYRQPIADALATVEGVEDVASVVSPFVAEEMAATSPLAPGVKTITDNRKIGFAIVQLDVSFSAVQDATPEGVLKAIQPLRDAGLTTEINGDLIPQKPGNLLGVGEIVGVLVALLVLAVTFRSLTAAGVPLVIAVVAVGLGVGGLFALSDVIEVDATSPVLAVMLGLAVGIDYSLFIVSRYRRYLREGRRNVDAARKAIATAGNAVIFAALTVIIALAALAVIQIPFLTTMGLAAAATVSIAAVVSVTLTPAILGTLGLRVFRKPEREPVLKAQAGQFHENELQRRHGWQVWGEGLQKYAVLVVVLVIGALGVIAYPATQLELGLPTDQYASKDSTQRKAYEILTRGFGAGFSGPLLVFVEDMPAVDNTTLAQAKQILSSSQQPVNPAALAQLPPEQLAAMQGQLDEGAKQLAPYLKLQQIGSTLQDVDNVNRVIPAAVTDDGTKGLLQVVPESGPADTKTNDLIEKIRTDGNEIIGDNQPGLYVTGTTAMQIDISDRLAEALPTYLFVVIGLSFLILVLAFRSLLVPLKATLGFLLSVVAMFGAMVAAFQWGWIGDPMPIISFLPILAIGILFGLAMDYEFFMVSSIHEAFVHGHDAKKAVSVGFAQGAKVVLAAAAIMTSIFAGFITHNEQIIQQVGLALAVGVLVDAVLIRMTLVPALLSLFGKAAWWLPGWLDKALPHVSIEGEEQSTKE